MHKIKHQITGSYVHTCILSSANKTLVRLHGDPVCLFCPRIALRLPQKCAAAAIDASYPERLGKELGLLALLSGGNILREPLA